MKLEVEAITPRGLNPALHMRFQELYGQLQRIAHRELVGTPRGTLCTTMLVHEAFMKLDGRELALDEQGRFLALASKAMRCVLIDHVRARQADKRGGDWARVTLLTDMGPSVPARETDLLDLENALSALQELEPRLVTLVECRFFGGMEFDDIATLLNVSRSTLNRDWRRARAFLQMQIGELQ